MTSAEDIKRLFGSIGKATLEERARAVLDAPSLHVDAYKQMIRELLDAHYPKDQPRTVMRIVNTRR